MQIRSSIAKKRLLINTYLKKMLPHIQGPHTPLSQAIFYPLLFPGKRLRPLLILHVLEDYGIPIHKGIDVACSIEMIHIYSLIHDDLPCMDNDDLRRGKATLHKVFGEGQALLTGNLFLTRAFEILTNKPQLLSILTSSSGVQGLIGGQTIDLFYERKKIDWKTLLSMYLKKTAALFSATLECAAIIAKTSEKDRLALKRAGKYFGLAFQIQDDLVDATTEKNKINSDLINKKATCLTLYNQKKTRDIAISFLDRALCSLPKHIYSLEKVFLFYLQPLLKHFPEKSTQK